MIANDFGEHQNEGIYNFHITIILCVHMPIKVEL